jgi:hypothetical protein
VKITKTGQPVLHNCTFTARVGGMDMTTVYPTAPITIPSGPYFMQTYVFTKPPKYTAYVDDDGDIFFSCNDASSQSYRFHIP